MLPIAFSQDQASDATGETEQHGLLVSGKAALTKSKMKRKHNSKWYSLYDKVYAPANLQTAWERVERNNGAPGIDGVTIKRFREAAEIRLQQLSGDLQTKQYRPQPVRRVYIEKQGGGKRPLGIPTVRDRIVQQALLQILEPIFEMKFSPRSHGFRPERGCVTALRVVDRAIECGYCWVVDADIRSFFDNVDHNRLIKAVNEEVSDGSVLKLIKLILTAGVLEPNVSAVEPTELGTPQGGPVSPLLANIYLHHFDQQMVAAGHGLVRYADDFIIFAKSEGEAQQALDLARQILEGELGLELHPEKTRIVSVDAGFEFLGFHYYLDSRGRRRKEVRIKSAKSFRVAIRKRIPRLRTQKRVKAKHCRLSRLAQNQRLKEIIATVNRFLKGWHWYFKTLRCPYWEPFRRFDEYVRGRIRLAITGRVGNGWWNQVIKKRDLQALGLLSLTDLQRPYQQNASPALVRKN